jgi:hypothetical protein
MKKNQVVLAFRTNYIVGWKPQQHGDRQWHEGYDMARAQRHSCQSYKRYRESDCMMVVVVVGKFEWRSGCPAQHKIAKKRKKKGWKRAQIMLHTGDIIPAIQLVSST